METAVPTPVADLEGSKPGAANELGSLEKTQDHLLTRLLAIHGRIRKLKKNDDAVKAKPRRKWRRNDLAHPRREEREGRKASSAIFGFATLDQLDALFAAANRSTLRDCSSSIPVDVLYDEAKAKSGLYEATRHFRFQIEGSPSEMYRKMFDEFQHPHKHGWHREPVDLAFGPRVFDPTYIAALDEDDERTARRVQAHFVARPDHFGDTGNPLHWFLCLRTIFGWHSEVAEGFLRKMFGGHPFLVACFQALEDIVDGMNYHREPCQGDPRPYGRCTCLPLSWTQSNATRARDILPH